MGEPISEEEYYTTHSRFLVILEDLKTVDYCTKEDLLTRDVLEQVNKYFLPEFYERCSEWISSDVINMTISMMKEHLESITNQVLKETNETIDIINNSIPMKYKPYPYSADDEDGYIRIPYFEDNGIIYTIPFGFDGTSKEARELDKEGNHYISRMDDRDSHKRDIIRKARYKISGDDYYNTEYSKLYFQSQQLEKNITQMPLDF